MGELARTGYSKLVGKSTQPVARKEKEEHKEEEMVSVAGVPCDKEPEPPPFLWTSAPVTTTECRCKISKEPPPWMTFGQKAMSGTCLTMQVGFILCIYVLLFTEQENSRKDVETNCSIIYNSSSVDMRHYCHLSNLDAKQIESRWGKSNGKNLID